MPTPTAPLTQCPACGARITRPELSLCSYCATPLRMGGPAQAADEATLQRLARMREHKDYAEAQTWEPNVKDDAPGSVRWRNLSMSLLLCGAVLAGFGLAMIFGGDLVAFGLVLTALAVIAWPIGLVLIGRSAGLVARVRRQPLLKRPALVIDRRSVTTPVGAGSQTVYFFSLQFEDGSAGEYSFLGRGGSYEVPTIGTTGLAVTRGARLLELLRLRV